MGRCKTLEPLVVDILLNNPETRKSDNLLILAVYDHLGFNPRLSFKTAMENSKKFKLPSFESITRARRKVQEREPLLKDEETAVKREELIQEFRDYGKYNM